MYELKKLYYECAHATYPVSLAALLKFAPTSQLLFGPEFLRALQRENAERLFPRFKI